MEKRRVKYNPDSNEKSIKTEMVSLQGYMQDAVRLAKENGDENLALRLQENLNILYAVDATILRDICDFQ